MGRAAGRAARPCSGHGGGVTGGDRGEADDDSQAAGESSWDVGDMGVSRHGGTPIAGRFIGKSNENLMMTGGTPISQENYLMGCHICSPVSWGYLS